MGPQQAVQEALDNPVLLPPLLLEGTVLDAVPGLMRRDPASGTWVFHIDSADPELGGYELILYPCRQLSDMENVLDLQGHEQVLFELTGEVFAYHNLNFVLPTHAPHQVIANQVEQEVQENVEVGQEDAPAAQGDSIRDIIDRLEQAVGPLVQDPGGDNLLREDPRLGDSGFLIWRRGRLVRRNSGGWLFVFDADTEGLADPPAIVLPCRMRESMETYALDKGGMVEVLMSGRMLSYRGTRYLVPSIFQAPRERSKLTP
jgi:hypothetical protein